jgi:hypothetical protein
VSGGTIPPIVVTADKHVIWAPDIYWAACDVSSRTGLAFELVWGAAVEMVERGTPPDAAAVLLAEMEGAP